MEKIEVMRKILAVREEDIAQMKRFFERLHRGDPRICKPEFSNPNYFARFGDAE